MKILLGINLGLGSSNFNLGDHIPNGKGILGRVNIKFILLLLLPLPLLLLLSFLLLLLLLLLFFSPYW